MPEPEDSAAPIIVIKKKVNHAGHHGGAWMVAYADFRHRHHGLLLFCDC